MMALMRMILMTMILQMMMLMTDDDDGDDDVASKFPRHLEVGGGAQRIVGGVATHTGEHTVTHTGATVWESTNLMLAILIAPLVIMMMMVTILVLQGQGA